MKTLVGILLAEILMLAGCAWWYMDLMAPQEFVSMRNIEVQDWIMPDSVEPEPKSKPEPRK